MNISTPAAALASIQGLSYFIIFFMFLLEGPILNYVASFASSLGFFNIFIIFILAILGNFIGDIILYCIGRFGKKAMVDSFIHKSLTSNRILKIKKYLKENPGKTITVMKITPILVTPGLIIAGAVNVSFKKFLFYSFLVSFLTAIVFCTLGFYSGQLFGVIYTYFTLGLYLIAVFILFVIGFTLLIKFLLDKISKKIEKI